MQRLFRELIIIFGITLFLVVFLEGFFSLFYFFKNLHTEPVFAERLYTEYDPLLGWVSKPEIFIPNMFGPDRHLQTNSQRFRNRKNFSSSLEDITRRWICVGDSFTFGYGVDNSQTWCSLLSSYIPRVETVNMGQGGYGLDQAYLWYKRDGIPLPHDVTIFAFINDDFNRMIGDTFLNYSKPVLGIRDGKIVTRNTPVPKQDFPSRYLPQYAKSLRSLRTVWALQEVMGIGKRDSDSAVAIQSNQELFQIVVSVFNDLQKSSELENRTMLFVHLPMVDDYQPNPYDSIRLSLIKEAEKYGWIYLDLISEYRKLEESLAENLFIPEGAIDFNLAAWHYNEQGNRFIAELILSEISKDSSLASRILPSDPGEDLPRRK